MSKYNVFVEDVSVEAVFNKLGGVHGARRFLAGEFVLTEAPIPKKVSKPELLPGSVSVSDFIICVRRSVNSTHPFWVKQVMHPELECAGPAKYDLQTVQQWLANDQNEVGITGDNIYAQLKETNTLVLCLNLQDGLAIQQKPIAVFRGVFASKNVVLWGAVVMDTEDNMYVPYLRDNGREVIELNWRWLGERFCSNEPALRFTPKPMPLTPLQ